MVLIGMAEAARRAGTTVDGIRNGLRNAHFPLVEISARALAVEEANLEAYIQQRGINPGPGRSRKIVDEREQGSRNEENSVSEKNR
jgi:hypothetical protein